MYRTDTVRDCRSGFSREFLARFATKVAPTDHLIIGIENSAPDLMPVGQREVIVLSLV